MSIQVAIEIMDNEMLFRNFETVPFIKQLSLRTMYNSTTDIETHVMEITDENDPMSQNFIICNPVKSNTMWYVAYSFCYLCRSIKYQGEVKRQELDAAGMLAVRLRDISRNVTEMVKNKVSTLKRIVQILQQ